LRFVIAQRPLRALRHAVAPALHQLLDLLQAQRDLAEHRLRQARLVAVPVHVAQMPRLKQEATEVAALASAHRCRAEGHEIAEDLRMGLLQTGPRIVHSGDQLVRAVGQPCRGFVVVAFSIILGTDLDPLLGGRHQHALNRVGQLVDVLDLPAVIDLGLP
jgi:hypothetical protein